MSLKLIIIQPNKGKFLSYLRSVFWFILLLVGLWLNYTFIGDGITMKMVIAILFFFAAVGKSKSKEFSNYSDAIDFLTKERDNKENQDEIR